MKEQCMICGSVVEDVSGICPVCGAVLGRSTQVNPADMYTGENRQPVNPTGTPSSNPSASYGQQTNAVGNGFGRPYNYQNGTVPYQANNGPKKKLFSILSIVFAIVGLLLSCCLPLLSLLLAIASLVMGIIALVKKQIKVPAILGLVCGGITVLISGAFCVLNFVLQLVVHTNLTGMFEQCWEAMEEPPADLSLTGMEIPTANGTEYYFMCDSDTLERVGENMELEYGTYTVSNYMSDEDIQDDMIDYVMLALGEGYEVKDVLYVETDVMGHKDHFYLVVEPDYELGDEIYYIDTSGAEPKLKRVNTIDRSVFDLFELQQYSE